MPSLENLLKLRSRCNGWYKVSRVMNQRDLRLRVRWFRSTKMHHPLNCKIWRKYKHGEGLRKFQKNPTVEGKQGSRKRVKVMRESHVSSIFFLIYGQVFFQGVRKYLASMCSVYYRFWFFLRIINIHGVKRLDFFNVQIASWYIKRCILICLWFENIE